MIRNILIVITQTFKAKLEACYRPTDQGLCEVQLGDLQAIRTDLQKDAAMKVLAARNVAVIARQTGERSADTAGVDAPMDLDTHPMLDLQVIQKLITSCGDGAPGPALVGRQERPRLEGVEAGKGKAAAGKKTEKGKGKAQDPGELISAFAAGVLTYWRQSPWAARERKAMRKATQGPRVSLSMFMCFVAS